MPLRASTVHLFTRKDLSKEEAVEYARLSREYGLPRSNLPSKLLQRLNSLESLRVQQKGSGQKHRRLYTDAIIRWMRCGQNNEDIVWPN